MGHASSWQWSMSLALEAIVRILLETTYDAKGALVIQLHVAASCHSFALTSFLWPDTRPCSFPARGSAHCLRLPYDCLSQMFCCSGSNFAIAAAPSVALDGTAMHGKARQRDCRVDATCIYWCIHRAVCNAMHQICGNTLRLLEDTPDMADKCEQFCGSRKVSAPVDVSDKREGTPPSNCAQHQKECQADCAIVQEEERALHGARPAPHLKVSMWAVCWLVSSYIRGLSRLHSWMDTSSARP